MIAQFHSTYLEAMMVRAALISLVILLTLAAVWTVIRFKTAGHTWEVAHDCGDRGPLSEHEFIKAAVSQTMRPSKDSPYFIHTSKMKINRQFASDFIYKYPDCCSIYKGSSNDYFSKESFYDAMTRKFAKVVKIKFTSEDIINDKYVGTVKTYYVKLDECGNQIE